MGNAEVQRCEENFFIEFNKLPARLRNYFQNKPDEFRRLVSINPNMNSSYCNYIRIIDIHLEFEEIPLDAIVETFFKLVIMKELFGREKCIDVLTGFDCFLELVDKGELRFEELVFEMNRLLKNEKFQYLFDYLSADVYKSILGLILQKKITIHQAVDVFIRVCAVSSHEVVNLTLTAGVGVWDCAPGNFSLNEVCDKFIELSEEMDSETFCKIVMYGFPIYTGRIIYQRCVPWGWRGCDRRAAEKPLSRFVTLDQFLWGLVRIDKSCKNQNSCIACIIYGLVHSWKFLEKVSWEEVIGCLIKIKWEEGSHNNGVFLAYETFNDYASFKEIISVYDALRKKFNLGVYVGLLNSEFLVVIDRLIRKPVTENQVSFNDAIKKVLEVFDRAILDLVGDSIVLRLYERGITFVEIMDNLSDLNKKSLYGLEALFYFIGLWSTWVNRENWRRIIDAFIEIGNSKGLMRTLIVHFDRGLNLEENLSKFWEYFILYEPKKIPEVIRGYGLLRAMNLPFEEELSLLLSIASPLSLKQNNFDNIVIIMTPVGQLNQRIRKFFFGKLDRCLLVFQGNSGSFVRAFQSIDGMEIVDNYSYVELVYIYLRFANDPELKVKSLNKSLENLRKAEARILGIISGKRGINDLKGVEPEKLKASFEKITQMFFDLAVNLYTERSLEIARNEVERRFGVKIVAEKIKDPNFQNAMTLLGRLEREKETDYLKFLYALIEDYLNSKTYPLGGKIQDCYPWTLEANKTWIATNLKNSVWFQPMVKEYRITEEDLSRSNVDERIEHHIEEAKRVLEQMGISKSELNFQDLERIYTELCSKDKKDVGLLRDLKTQIDGIRSAEGDRNARKNFSKKIMILPEFNPLLVLQMGNFVDGSCLSVSGINYWSTIVNAIDVNKRVLWAMDKEGKVLARVLIAIDSDGKIVKFPVYYATGIPLEKFYNDYILELAKKAELGINGSSKKVVNINFSKWYMDPEVGFES